ncbi:hypothetical protein ETU10_06050 [Apibacter muscae]|uniref:glycerophosphoryl diester phosphodiesterase membrane domain-containing protein n=1 Tax=Apibacter muscae TaxID=2509004 RepID=UPI0011ACE431|nr:glycerophosphoryl diester phosphodiesterase membrane domain-containing protein [Apibacter muscae]TWP23793.1 hypothetical protein ETU10_06050 [Apibacter muscae]
MNSIQKFDFVENRSLSKIITDSFRFAWLNLKSLSISLFYICFIPILIYGLTSYLYFNDYFSSTLSLNNTEGFENLNFHNFILEIQNSGLIRSFSYLSLTYIGALLLSMFISIVSFSYIKLYQNVSEITPSSVWKTSKKYFPKILFYNVLLILTIIIGNLICLIPLMLWKLGIIVTILLYIIFTFLIFYLYIKILFSPLFIILEDKGVWDSIKNSFNFTKNIFWETFLFCLIFGIITSMISSLFKLPGTILLYISSILGIINDNDPSDNTTVLSSLLIGLGGAFGFLMYSLKYVGTCFFYYSTKEKRQGYNTYKELDKIGVYEAEV